MKKAVIFTMIACLLVGCVALAESQVELDFYYDDVLKQYASATSNGVTYIGAQGEFEDLVGLFDNNPGLTGFKDAYQYYAYANGRLAIYAGNYSEAVEQLTLCSSFGDAAEYLSFSKGMLYEQNANYEYAISAFQEAQKCTLIASMATQKISECRQQYKAQLLELGNEAFAVANYELALNYYSKLMEVFPESEGATLYEDCLTQMNAGTPESISMFSGVTESSSSIKLSWSGTATHCSLMISSNMNATMPSSASMELEIIDGQPSEYVCKDGMTEDRIDIIATASSEKQIVLSGLMPGTVYYFSLMEEGAKNEVKTQVETEAPKQYTKFSANKLGYYSYSLSSYYAVLQTKKQNVSPWYALAQGSNLISAGQNDLVVSNSLLDKNGYLLCVRIDRDITAEELQDQTCHVVFHVSNMGTVLERVNISLYSANVLAIEINESILKAIDQYGNIQGQKYTLDCLLDECLLGSMEGMLN